MRLISLVVTVIGLIDNHYVIRVGGIVDRVSPVVIIVVVAVVDGKLRLYFNPIFLATAFLSLPLK